MISNWLRARDKGDYYSLPFAGAAIGRCCVGSRLELQIHSNPGLVIAINGRFRLSLGSVDHEIQPWERASCGPFILLFNHTISDARIRKNGTLQIRFEQGVNLEVPPSNT